MPQLDPRDARQHHPLPIHRHQVVGQQAPALLHQGIGQGGFAGSGMAQAHDRLAVLLQRVAVEHQHAPLDQQRPHRRTQQKGADVLVVHAGISALPANALAICDPKAADALHREPQIAAGHLQEWCVVGAWWQSVAPLRPAQPRSRRAVPESPGPESTRSARMLCNAPGCRSSAGGMFGLSFAPELLAAVWVDTAMTPAVLEATKGLVRLVLQREREGHRDAPACSDQVPARLQHQLDRIPREALLAAIRRHRLACVMHGDPLVARLLPELAPTIQALARQETMDAMALASLTREMAALFEQAAIPMLVIKGIPLALQTTGSLTARGRGDLDVLVEPNRLPEAVALLEAAGFSRPPGLFPRQLNSVWGRCSRGTGYELDLVRREPNVQWIDLHWALSHVRAPLPSFALAWHCGEQLDLNGQSVTTLSRTHAFQHACAHAAKDQWMCLRNLVDIDRLADQLKGKDLSTLSHQRMVCWSCAVTHATTKNEALRPLMRRGTSGSTTALARATQAQVMPWRRSQGPGPWTPRRWASMVWRLLVLSRDARDWLRTLLFFALLPAAFSDPETGEDRGLAGFLVARITWLRQRLHEQRSSHRAATASGQGEHSRP